MARIDTRYSTVQNLKSLFDEGIFTCEGGELFNEDELSIFINNILDNGPIPFFGARESQICHVYFKSSKIRQVVDRMVKMAESAQPLMAHRLLHGCKIPFVAISDGEFYNPGITRAEINKLIYFYL